METGVIVILVGPDLELPDERLEAECIELPELTDVPLEPDEALLIELTVDTLVADEIVLFNV